MWGSSFLKTERIISQRHRDPKVPKRDPKVRKNRENFANYVLKTKDKCFLFLKWKCLWIQKRAVQLLKALWHFTVDPVLKLHATFQSSPKIYRTIYNSYNWRTFSAPFLFTRKIKVLAVFISIILQYLYSTIQ